jgi:uncharacterized membrane protein
MTAGIIGPVMGQMGMHGSAGSGWWMGGMMLWMVVFWMAIISGAVWLAHAVFDGRGRAPKRPQDILDERFAEGVISRQEYLERRALIQGARNSSQTDASAKIGTTGRG